MLFLVAMESKKNKKTAKNVPKNRKNWTLLLITAVVLITAGVILTYMFYDKTPVTFLSSGNSNEAKEKKRASDKAKGQNIDSAGKLQANLTKKFTELELKESEYTVNFSSSDSTLEINASIPRGRPIEWLMWELANSAGGTPYSVEDGVCASADNCAMTFKSADPKYPKVNLKIRRSGRYFSGSASMAIIIEDFGFEPTQTITEYLSFPHPLTVSLVAAQKRAPWTAQIANEYKKEVILLLPMEPLPTAELVKHKQAMIMVHHSEDRIRNSISLAASSIPELSGVSNFHGRRVMEDSRVMEIILSEISRRKGYFVYTETSRNSAAHSLSLKHKVPSALIQGSIEASDSPERIREKLRRFSMAAEKTGRIIIKAPPNAAFIAVLKEELQTMSENGIKLVYVSELVK